MRTVIDSVRDNEKRELSKWMNLIRGQQTDCGPDQLDEL